MVFFLNKEIEFFSIFWRSVRVRIWIFSFFIIICKCKLPEILSNHWTVCESIKFWLVLFLLGCDLLSNFEVA